MIATFRTSASTPSSRSSDSAASSARQTMWPVATIVMSLPSRTTSTPAAERLGDVLVDDRRRGAAETHVHRLVALVGLHRRAVGLVVVGGDDHLHPRHRPHQRDVLDHLVGGAVLAERDAAVRGADPDRQLVVGDAQADLVVGAPGGEDREGGAVGALAGRGQPAGHRHHVRLGGAAVEEPVRELLAELHRLGGDREVGVERDDVLVRLAELDQGVAVGLPGRGRLGRRRAISASAPCSALVCASSRASSSSSASAACSGLTAACRGSRSGPP